MMAESKKAETSLPWFSLAGQNDDVVLSDITEYMSDYLTDFMIPEYFVELKKLPLNANGKVDKTMLPNLLRKVAA